MTRLMDEHDDARGAAGRMLKRRGILAAAATVVAGIVAKQAAAPVAAEDGFLVMATGNTESARTDITADASFTDIRVFGALAGTSGNNIAGVVGFGGGNKPGVIGNGGSNNGSGVQGNSGGIGIGVEGSGGNVAGSIGVQGTGGLVGVKGISTVGGTGVLGIGDSQGSGVKGTGGSNAGLGVEGVGGAGGGTGVQGTGTGTTSIGVEGVSGGGTSGIGVKGTGAAFGIGVQGSASNAGTLAVEGVVPSTSTSASTTRAVRGFNQSTNGSGIGVDGNSTAGIGGQFTGGKAPMRLVPQASGTGAPTTGTHAAGEFYVDSAGALFYCTTAGTPGTWQQLNGGLTGTFVPLGATSSSAATTQINLTGSGFNTQAIRADNNATGTGGIGVEGRANGPAGTGVQGISVSGIGVSGIVGTTSGGHTRGVIAHNQAGGIDTVGLEALVFLTAANNSVAVQGQNTSTGTGGVGVLGQCDVATGTGVKGLSTNGVAISGIAGSGGAGSGVYGVSGVSHGGGVSAGLFGSSDTAYGIVGSTTAAGYSGLTAITGTAGVAALAATATVNTAFAAYFQGSTVVQGDFAVVGGAKNAAVKDAAGQHRLVYCMESPEAWFEDFGEATLVGGKASVMLEKTFAEIVRTDTYHVYLTPHDAGNQGLAATARMASGFTVQELHGGTGGGSFSWRVVAKRKDIKGERLAKFDLPKINHPDPAKLPKPVVD
jgi:hypothetical protein